MAIRQQQKRTTVTPEMEDKIVKALMDPKNAEKSLKQIGGEFGVTASTVSRINGLYSPDGTKIAANES